MATDESFTSWIECSPGETIRFGDLGRLMATALHGETFAVAAAEINLEDELPKLVRAGVLTPRDPLGMGPHPLPIGEALKNARLRPDDELRDFLADRGIGLRILPTFALAARPQRVPPELAALPDDTRVMFTSPTTTGAGKASDLREMIRDAMARQIDGFFEVWEVAQVLAEARGGDWRDFTEDMRKAWQNDQLRMRYPGKRTVRTGPDNRFSAFEWVSVEDVNAWLKADGCGYEFPAVPIAAEGQAEAKQATADIPTKASQAAKREARQDARLAHCEARGLVFDKDPLRPLPYGIGQAAASHVPPLTRQSLSTDIRAALRRRFERERNGKG